MAEDTLFAHGYSLDDALAARVNILRSLISAKGPGSAWVLNQLREVTRPDLTEAEQTNLFHDMNYVFFSQVMTGENKGFKAFMSDLEKKIAERGRERDIEDDDAPASDMPDDRYEASPQSEGAWSGHAEAEVADGDSRSSAFVENSVSASSSSSANAGVLQGDAARQVETARYGAIAPCNAAVHRAAASEEVVRAVFEADARDLVLESEDRAIVAQVAALLSSTEASDAEILRIGEASLRKDDAMSLRASATPTTAVMEFLLTIVQLAHDQTAGFRPWCSSSSSLAVDAWPPLWAEEGPTLPDTLAAPFKDVQDHLSFDFALTHNATTSFGWPRAPAAAPTLVLPPDSLDWLREASSVTPMKKIAAIRSRGGDLVGYHRIAFVTQHPHWFVVVMDLCEKAFWVFDSQSDSVMQHHLHAVSTLDAWFQQQWTHFVRALPVNTNLWPVEMHPNNRRLEDSADSVSIVFRALLHTTGLRSTSEVDAAPHPRSAMFQALALVRGQPEFARLDE
jgi:hypothetical protein